MSSDVFLLFFFFSVIHFQHHDRIRRSFESLLSRKFKILDMKFDYELNAYVLLSYMSTHLLYNIINDSLFEFKSMYCTRTL